jgi:hypothetical protein
MGAKGSGNIDREHFPLGLNTFKKGNGWPAGFQHRSQLAFDHVLLQ